MFKKIFKFRLLLLPLICSIFFSCAKKENNVPESTFEGLSARTDEFIGKNKKYLAIESLEKMMEQYSDNSDISKYRLRLADLYFEKAEYESAYNYYKRFYKLNPSDPQSEYANCRGVLCRFYQTFGIKRDPTNIRKALKKCDKYLAKAEFRDEKYIKEVKDIRYTCDKMLIDREIYIYNFYLRKGKLKSAQNRLKYIREEFAEKHPQLEPQILYLEAKYAARKKETDKAKQKATVLAQNYPESKFTEMAARLTRKKRIPFPY